MKSTFKKIASGLGESVSVTNQSAAVTLSFVRQTQKDAQLKANWTIFSAIAKALGSKEIQASVIIIIGP